MILQNQFQPIVLGYQIFCPPTGERFPWLRLGVQ